MNQYFEDLTLSSSGRPVLFEDEVECIVLQNVHVSDQDDKNELKNLVVTLTTCRILFLTHHHQSINSSSSSSSGIGKLEQKASSIQNQILTAPKFLHLQHVHKLEKKTYFFGQPRILLFTSNNIILKLHVPEHREKFFELLETQLKRRSWQSVKKDVTPVIESGKAGLSALKKAYYLSEEKQKETLKQAFQDVDSLMEYAKELVQLAEKFSEKNQKLSSLSSDIHGGDDNDVKDFLIEMGISSPVTKKATGSLYHQQLCRQLADFLPKHLEKTGMMTLVDAYCIYNRARGTDLISPEDMYRACSLFEELHIDTIKMKRFESAVIVLQLKKYNEEEMMKEIMKLLIVKEQDSVSPLELSKVLGLTVILAKEQLVAVEATGKLCRDESIEGVRFYLNLFNDLLL